MADTPNTSLLAPRVLLATQGLIAVLMVFDAWGDAFGDGMRTGVAGPGALTIPCFPLVGAAILLLRDYPLRTKAGYMVSYAGFSLIQYMALIPMLS